MKKLLLISCLTVLNIFAQEIPTEKTELRKFGKSVDVNSQIIQLSSTKQSITTLLDGRIKQYYIKPGQKIRKGQKVALIESIALSEMSAKYLSLKEQYKSLLDNYTASKTLQQKGIVSLQELNKANIERNEMLSKLNALKSQLYAVGINTKKLKKTTSNYILYSHTSGVISDLVKPLHSAVSKDDELFTVVKNQAFYLKSFVPLEYSQNIKVGQRISLKYNGNVFNSSIERVLPEVDLQTQRMVVLSSLEKTSTYLLANVFVPSTIYFNTGKSYISVKKTALSFLNNEWVVFIPTKESEEKDSYDIDNDRDEKDSHSEEEPQYEARDVKIIVQDDIYVAIEGLNINEEYVSDKTYYVKSLVLKSSMGDGHGH